MKLDLTCAWRKKVWWKPTEAFLLPTFQSRTSWLESFSFRLWRWYGSNEVGKTYPNGSFHTFYAILFFPVLSASAADFHHAVVQVFNKSLSDSEYRQGIHSAQSAFEWKALEQLYIHVGKLRRVPWEHFTNSHGNWHVRTTEWKYQFVWEATERKAIYKEKYFLFISLRRKQLSVNSAALKHYRQTLWSVWHFIQQRVVPFGSE